MRLASVGCTVLIALGQVSVEAQQADQAASAVRPRLQAPQRLSLVIPPLFPLIPEGSRRLGMLTLAAPDTDGGIVKVIVPIGEMTTRLARKISGAHDQRRQRKARDEVQRALRDFQAQRTAR
jgi:hypothetical protein